MPTTEALTNASVTTAFSILGAIALHFIYESIKTRWPDVYTSVTTGLEEQVRSSPVRSLLIFRAAPVFIIVSFNTTLSDRYGGSAIITGIAICSLHLALTNIRAALAVARPPRRYNGTLLLFHHAATFITVIISSALAIYCTKWTDPFIPPTRDLLVATWAGLFASLFATATRALMARKKLSDEAVIEQLVDDIGEDAWSYVSNFKATDPREIRIAKAIILAECQQRPRWFRRLERVKGRLWKQGTYGVAQVAADGPITDRESIDRLITRLQGHIDRDPESGENFARLTKSFLLDHNPDRDHAQRIQSFYDTLSHFENTGYYLR